MEGLVFLVSEQVAAAEFGLEATDDFHRIVVCGMKVFLAGCPYSQILVVVTVQSVQGISIILDDVEDGTDLVVGRGVQVSHRAAHYVHKRLEVIILLLDQVVLDSIAFDEIVLEDRVRPPPELHTSLTMNTIPYTDYNIQIIDSCRFIFGKSIMHFLHITIIKFTFCQCVLNVSGYYGLVFLE